MSQLDTNWKKALLGLLPKGIAWNRQSPTMNLLMEALAMELSRVQSRAAQLLVEADPRTTTEWIDDWERITGLPDDCTGESETLQERRAQVVARLTLTGPLNKEFYINLARELGYDVTVEENFVEFNPLEVPFEAGDEVNGEDMLFAFEIAIPDETLITYFRASESEAGDFVETFGDSALECLIERYKPAHTVAIISFAGEVS